MKTSERNVLKGYYWNHDAIRRDVIRLETIVIKTDYYNEAGFQNAFNWFNMHSKALQHHHQREHNYLFPELNKCSQDFNKQIALMDLQHKDLNKWITNVNDSFKLLTMDCDDNAEKQKLKEALITYKDLTVQHLTIEEPIVESAIENVTNEEVMQMEQNFMTNLSFEIKHLTMPWMLDAMDNKDIKYFMGIVPLRAKLLYRVRLLPKYNKLVSNL